MVHALILNLLLVIAVITNLLVVWLLVFVRAFCWFVFWGLSLFLGNPLQRANCSFVVARLSWCGSKQKLLMKLPSRKTVKGGSSMNSKNWSVSSVLMNRRVWVCGSPFEPFAGESPIIQSRRRVVACSGIAPLLSGKRCKPRVGGVARHQCVVLRICKIGHRPVWFSIRQRILDRRVHCARTDKFWFHEQNRPHSPQGVQTSCIPFQRISTHRLRIPAAASFFAWISRRRTLQRVNL